MSENWMSKENTGMWTVLDEYIVTKSGERKYLCRCDCGTERYVLEQKLRAGSSKGCGCKKEYHFSDITGKRFNSLTALHVVSRSRGKVIWHCRCDCGNEIDLSYNDLVYSNRKSCGCLRAEHNKRLNESLTHFGGTSLDMIRSKTVPSDSTTGVRGVYYIKGKYRAKIVFRKKAYYLGVYDNLEDAAKARAEAEAELFDQTVEHYAKWSARAARDPEWARNNPIQISVIKIDSQHIRVHCLPDTAPIDEEASQPSSLL